MDCSIRPDFRWEHETRGFHRPVWRILEATTENTWFPFNFPPKNSNIKIEEARLHNFTVPSISHTNIRQIISWSAPLWLKGLRCRVNNCIILHPERFVVPTVSQLITNRSWKKKQKVRSARHFKGGPVWMIKWLLQPTKLPLSHVCLWWMINMQKTLAFFGTLWKRTRSF